MLDAYIRGFSSAGRGFGAPSVMKTLGIPCFTSDDSETQELQLLGVPAFTRKSVGSFLESLGARKPEPTNPDAVQQSLMPELAVPNIPQKDRRQKPPRQAALFGGR